MAVSSSERRRGRVDRQKKSGSCEPLRVSDVCALGVLLLEFEEFRGQEGGADGDGNAGENDDGQGPVRADRHQGVCVAGTHFFHRSFIGKGAVEPDLRVIANGRETHDDGGDDIAGPAVFHESADRFRQDQNDEKRDDMPGIHIPDDDEKQEQAGDETGGNSRRLYSPERVDGKTGHEQAGGDLVDDKEDGVDHAQRATQVRQHSIKDGVEHHPQGILFVPLVHDKEPPLNRLL